MNLLKYIERKIYELNPEDHYILYMKSFQDIYKNKIEIHI